MVNLFREDMRGSIQDASLVYRESGGAWGELPNMQNVLSGNLRANPSVHDVFLYLSNGGMAILVIVS